MAWMDGFAHWLHWLGAWIDWLWAAGWILAGVLGTHLLWWYRHNRLAGREKEVREQLSRIESRHRDIRRHTEELSRREAALKKMEESLRLQTEQLMPQIEQIRGWLDQVAKREQVPTATGEGKPGRPTAPPSASIN